MNDSSPIEILIVEDNEDDLNMTLRALRKANLANHMHVVRDGAEALAYIHGTVEFPGHKLSHLPKLILLDLKLPKVDGLEVLKRIRNNPYTLTVPVVIMTSSKEQRDVVESYKLGVNSYIVKPVNFEGFAAAVQQLGMYWLLLNQPPQP